MNVTIEFCVQWNYRPQAAGLAAELKAAYPDCEIELKESGGGAFEVTVDGRQIYSKLSTGKFPEYQEIPNRMLG